MQEVSPSDLYSQKNEDPDKTILLISFDRIIKMKLQDNYGPKLKINSITGQLKDF
jgi:hypothetical protein